MSTTGAFSEYLNDRYPYETAEGFDNCGLLIGSSEKTVTRCVLALDATSKVILDAAESGAELLITHHPVIFNKLATLMEGSIPYLCVKKDLSVISIHTCLDRAEDGVNDRLAQTLDLSEISDPGVGEGYIRTGLLPDELKPEAFLSYCKEKLSCDAISGVPGNHPVRRVAVCSGAGGSFLEDAISLGVDAFVTGEVKHHEALLAAEAGITLVHAGHFETETVVLEALKRELEARFPDVAFEISKQNQSPFVWL